MCASMSISPPTRQQQRSLASLAGILCHLDIEDIFPALRSSCSHD